ncbi:Vesicle-fusing ATPase [Caenorhabditis elegans]|nr:Vesicle-fusing ATPase [Caenorhabditis elegans]CAL44963.1 Vesicle-fusing ATPase [Caenorhabditis elegans]|eukprot:NP_001076604.1 Vesicle-fusing ATPase [Caenorhabditis elegans]
MFRVRKAPSEEHTLANYAYVNRSDFDDKQIKHVRVNPGPAHHYIFSIRNDGSIKPGEIAFGVPHRKWAALSLDQEVRVTPFTFQQSEYVGSMILTADFNAKKNVTSEPLNADLMAREFSIQFGGQAFSKGMQMAFRFEDKEKNKTHTLSLVVKSIEGFDIGKAAAAASGASNTDSSATKPKQIEAGELLPNSVIVFDKEEGSMLNLIGKSKGKSAYRSIINPDWDFQQMGIGGLDTEFSHIFRRAFASRVFPPEFIEQLGMKHVRGILLFGPPGTGKTLMARQIGKMLNAREPKIVNGPQILDKYVGESESNVRKLFADAEEEWRRCGANSGLHIIIFDEIDAICKQRGSMAGSSSVHDTVVNQLLSKMDGVEQLNNILVIGMTNRRDMIDEALLRPGRLEVQMEVSLPDETGRLQILKIHTARMREYNKMDPNVDLEDISKRTKNFSGAELEGLVRAAQSSAMNRLVKAGGKAQADPDAIEKLAINSGDFDYALENDIKPAFGRSDESLNRFLSRGMIVWGPEVTKILDEGSLLAATVKNPENSGFRTVVLAGAAKTGKTSLAAQMAKSSDFPFVKVISPEDTVGFSESAKCMALKKAFEDAKRSKLSVLLIDNLERLIDYHPVGPRYSNLVIQALLVLLNAPPPAGHRLFVIATSSDRMFLRDMGLMDVFGDVIDIPKLTTAGQMMNVIQESNIYSDDQLPMIEQKLASICRGEGFHGVGIKHLLELIESARQCEADYRVPTLLNMMEGLALNLYR